MYYTWTNCSICATMHIYMYIHVYLNSWKYQHTGSGREVAIYSMYIMHTSLSLIYVHVHVHLHIHVHLHVPEWKYQHNGMREVAIHV